MRRSPIISWRADEVLVKVANTGFCGSDHSLVAGGLLPDGYILGHEISAVVVEKGAEAGGPAVGTRVCIRPTYCGHCANCLCGQTAALPGSPANHGDRRPARRLCRVRQGLSADADSHPRGRRFPQCRPGGDLCLRPARHQLHRRPDGVRPGHGRRSHRPLRRPDPQDPRLRSYCPFRAGQGKARDRPALRGRSCL